MDPFNYVFITIAVLIYLALVFLVLAFVRGASILSNRGNDDESTD